MKTLDAGQVKRLRKLFDEIENDKENMENRIFVEQNFKGTDVERLKFLQGQIDILGMVLEMIGEKES